jgi:hypothetical protein
MKSVKLTSHKASFIKQLKKTRSLKKAVTYRSASRSIKLAETIIYAINITEKHN